MEIEKKYLIDALPMNLSDYSKASISQGYLSIKPTIRIRKRDKDYFLTCKSKGLLAREEFEMKISEEEFLSLLKKVEHHMITKDRYFIPYKDRTIELDIFHGRLEGLIIAEVEFDSIDQANSFSPPSWFRKEVTNDPAYQNSSLCQK